jgi:hypothetical protein
MRLNFHVAFKNALGNDAYEMINGDKHVQMIDDAICQGLFDGRFLNLCGEEGKDARLKLQAFELYQKIRTANGDVEITTEEASMIKQMALLLSPGAYGQIYQLIEGVE